MSPSASPEPATAAGAPAGAAASATSEIAGESAALNPVTSERKYHRDAASLTQREIWRPGDGDGDKGTDYYDRQGTLLPIEARWRLFQSDIGTISRDNLPPAYVLLDDRATADLHASEIPRSQLVKQWPHDFGGSGVIRARRPHRGRAAIRDPQAPGLAQYRHTTTGQTRNNVYHFTGERDYVPIIYAPLPTAPPSPLVRKRKEPTKETESYTARGHGHNQYTPKDMLVKLGAPSFAMNQPPKKKKKINAFLYADPKPPNEAHHRPYAELGESMREASQRSDAKAYAKQLQAARRKERESSKGESSKHHDDDEESDQEFPIARPQKLYRALGDFDNTVPPASETPSQASPEPAQQPRGPVVLPDNMGFLERMDIERDLAAKTLNALRGQEDVTNMAKELAAGLVTIAKQEQDVKKAQQELELAKSEVEELKAEVERAGQYAEECKAAAEVAEGIVALQGEQLETLQARVDEQERIIEHFRDGEDAGARLAVGELEAQMQEQNAKTFGGL